MLGTVSDTCVSLGASGLSTLQTFAVRSLPVLAPLSFTLIHWHGFDLDDMRPAPKNT